MPAKRKAARKTKANVQSVNLPKGFKQTNVEGSFGQTHDWEKNPILEGVCIDIRNARTGKGRAAKDTQVMTVKTDDGMLHSVWHSYNLDGLFKAKPKGKRVFIGFQGFQKIQGRPNPMKLFTTGIK